MSEKTQNNPQNRVLYFDFLRILATLAVIVIHVAAQNWYSVGVGTSEWYWFTWVDSAVRWGGPVFVMISGALFLDPDRPLDLKKLYGHNILRMITCFLFWTAVYGWDLSRNGADFKQVVTALITGRYHMWFLFMIVGIYLITPLLRKITADKKTTDYFLWIGLVFTVLIPKGLQLLECLDLPHTYTVVQGLKTAFAQTHFHFTLGYVFYFVLGYRLAKFNLRPWLRWVLCLLGIAGVFVSAGLTDWYSEKTGVPDTAFFEDLSFGSLMMGVGVFVFGKYVLSRIRLTGWPLKVLKRLSKCTFGVYLVHVLMISKFYEWWGIHTLSYHPALSMLILTAGVTGLSFLISWVLNLIPGVRKYIV